MNNNLFNLQNHKLIIERYFFDLDLAVQTTWGLNRIVKRNLWLISCYCCFALGVFARQIFSFNEITISFDNSRINWMSLIAALAVGLAIFPFALRTIIKLVTWILNDPMLPKKQGFNIIHLMASYAIGYFFKLIAHTIPDILSKIG